MKHSDALEVITGHEATTENGNLLELLTRAEVARRFGVAPQTIARWARQGILPSVRTLGGQRRYPAEAVRRLVSETLGRTGDSGSPPREAHPEAGGIISAAEEGSEGR